MDFQILSLNDFQELELIYKSIKTSDLPKWTSTMIEESLRAGQFYGARESQHLLAFICAKKIADSLYEIEFLATHPDHQKKGIMNKLWLYFLASTQAHEVWLEVSDRNLTALSVYKNWGFKENSLRKGYYSDGSNAINMSYLSYI